MATDLKPDFLLPPSVEVAAEEAAATGVRLTAMEFLPVVIVLGMLAGAAAWLRPQLKAQSSKSHSVLWRVVTWPARKLLQGIISIEHKVEHAMSHWLAPKVGTVAHAFNSVTHEIHTATQALADLADNTHEAFTFLRHHVIPELIAEARKELTRGIAKVQAELDALESRLQAAVNIVEANLAYIGVVVKGPLSVALGALSAVVVDLYMQVYKVIEPQLALLTKTVNALKLEVGKIAVTVYDDVLPRLKALEEALAPAALAAAIAAVLAKSYAYLTCRNTKTAASALCAADENMVDEILALLAGAFLFLSLEEYVKLMQGVAADTTILMQDLLRV